MKLVVQVPCLNEEETVAAVINAVPRRISGVDEVCLLMIDDGSTDNSKQVAITAGVDIYEANLETRGLAFSFQRGLELALSEGADIIVNIDADFQYDPIDIEAVIQPILRGRADMVIGNRKPWKLPHFSLAKRLLHWLGCRTVSILGGVKVDDVTCGLRAFSKSLAQSIKLRDSYTYTLETIFHAAGSKARILSLEVKAYPTPRPSRLMTSTSSYIAHSIVTINRSLFIYQTRRAIILFLLIGLTTIGLFLIIC